MKGILLLLVTVTAFANWATAEDLDQIQMLVDNTYPHACNSQSSDVKQKALLGTLVDQATQLIDDRITKIKAISSTELTDSEKTSLIDPYTQKKDKLVKDKACQRLTTAAQTLPSPSTQSDIPNPSLRPLPQMVFDDTEVGANQELDVSITNIDGTSPVKVWPPEVDTTDIKADPNEKDSVFRVVGNDCPASLGHSESCKVKVRFSPPNGKNAFTARVKIPSQKLDPSGNPTGDKFVDVFEVRGKGFVANVAGLYKGNPGGTPVTRIVAGIDISGASSASGQQKFFLEAGLDTPIGFTNSPKDPLDRSVWLFLTPRISSIAQSPTPIANLNTSGDFLGSSLSSTNTTQLVQSVDIAGGVEYMFLKPRHGIPFWGQYPNTHAKIGAGLILGVGAITPFTTPEGTKAAQEFVVNDSIKNAYPSIFTSTNTKTVAAFVNRDRSRFFRKYYGGVRLKTYYFTDKARMTPKENGNTGCTDQDTSSDCDPVYNIFPGTIDLAVGQDESITGGALRGLTFRLEAVYPLPFVPGLHIYGGMYTALSRNRSTNPLILLPPSPLLDLNDPKVQIIPVDPLNRDSYRLGIGFDLLQLFKKKPVVAADATKK